jgi:hypothetical protein
MGFSVLEIGWYVHGREEDGESAGVNEWMKSGLRKGMCGTEIRGAFAKTRLSSKERRLANFRRKPSAANVDFHDRPSP